MSWQARGGTLSVKINVTSQRSASCGVPLREPHTAQIRAISRIVRLPNGYATIPVSASIPIQDYVCCGPMPCFSKE